MPVSRLAFQQVAQLQPFRRVQRHVALTLNAPELLQEQFHDTDPGFRGLYYRGRGAVGCKAGRNISDLVLRLAKNASTLGLGDRWIGGPVDTNQARAHMVNASTPRKMLVDGASVIFDDLLVTVRRQLCNLQPATPPAISQGLDGHCRDGQRRDPTNARVNAQTFCLQKRIRRPRKS